MCVRKSLCRVLNHPDDGEDNFNPRRGRRGFSAFVSLARTPDPDNDPTWEASVIPADEPISDPGAEAAWREFIAIVPGPNSPARVIPMDPPPVAIRLPFEADAWTDPDHEDETHAEEVVDRRNKWGFPDLYSNEIG